MANRRRKINNFKKNGFSLIEIMVSMAIFMVIIGSVVLFSVRTLEAHTKSQAMQNALENARFAIENLNKKIRTSHAIKDYDNSTSFGTASDYLFFVDNVDMSKYCYRFSAATNALEVAKADDADPDENCGEMVSNGRTFTSLVGGGGNINVDGRFFIKETDSGSNQRGFVRTVVEIKYKESSGIVAEKDTVVIQSGVSLRDY